MSRPSTKQRKLKAFTLVELLIVIVIISILTGLVIAVIDPVRQRQRATDSATIATLEKIALALNSYNSATGTYPTCAQLMDEIANETPDCTNNRFEIAGIRDATGGARYFRYTSSPACLSVPLHLASDIDRNGTSTAFARWDTSHRVYDGAVCP